MRGALKFRVWNTNANDWLHDCSLKETVFGCRSGYHKSDSDGFAVLYPNGDHREYIIEQYTGLKDKNGKEIHEGDIVTVMGYGIYEVFWREWDSSFSLKPINTVKEETRILMLCEDWESDYEVIGNIHQDKELLDDA